MANGRQRGFSASKVDIRTFDGGMDQDTDPKLVSKNKFKDSQGMTLKRSGEHYALSIDKGPLFKKELDDDTTFGNIFTLKTLRSVYKIDGTDEECVTTWVYNSADTLMTVSCYVPSSDTLFTMYSETVTLASGERSVSAVVYRENDFDYIYFTNYKTPVKKMKCTITTASHVAYTDAELYLFRRAIRGRITAANPSYGGTGYLKCGSYQFYLRGIDNTNNRYSKWTAPSPVARVGMSHSTNEKSYAGQGHISNASISVAMEIQSAYSTLYTHYQLAVVENVDGLEKGSQVAKILTPQPIGDFSGTPGTYTYTYNSNSQAKEVVPIGEITVDDAAIDVVRALGIKNNHMLLGKVKLADLSYDGYKLIDGQRAEDYDNSPTSEGTFAGGSGYVLNEVITLADGSLVTVDGLNSGAVAQFTIDSTKSDGAVAGDVLVQVSTTGSGTGFTLTPDTDNVSRSDGKPVVDRSAVTNLVDAKSIATEYDPYADPQNATEDVGYFRDEVYRYYVSYFDDNMNFSRPVVLHFRGATNNKADITCPDWRFPSRKNKKYGALIDSTDNLQVLKLRLMGLDNHPKWAKGFVVLRAKRNKKIQFQTPMVPSILVQPAKAVGDYPDQRKAGDGTKLDVLNVEAADPFGSFIPKNYFHIVPKSLIRFGDFYSTTSETEGRAYVDNTTTDDFAYALRGSINGDFPIYPGETGAYKFTYDGTDEDIGIWKVDSWPTLSKILSTDNKTFKVYSRAIGTTSWGAAISTTTSYASPDVGSGYTPLDFSANDYKFEITDD